MFLITIRALWLLTAVSSIVCLILPDKMVQAVFFATWSVGALVLELQHQLRATMLFHNLMVAATSMNSEKIKGAAEEYSTHQKQMHPDLDEDESNS